MNAWYSINPCEDQLATWLQANHLRLFSLWVDQWIYLLGTDTICGSGFAFPACGT